MRQLLCVLFLALLLPMPSLAQEKTKEKTEIQVLVKGYRQSEIPQPIIRQFIDKDYPASEVEMRSLDPAFEIVLKNLAFLPEISVERRSLHGSRTEISRFELPSEALEDRFIQSHNGTEWGINLFLPTKQFGFYRPVPSLGVGLASLEYSERLELQRLAIDGGGYEISDAITRKHLWVSAKVSLVNEFRFSRHFVIRVEPGWRNGWMIAISAGPIFSF